MASPASKTSGLSQTVKFIALGAVSFAIPLVFFFQANQLKLAENKRYNDSLQLVLKQLELKNFEDTSLLVAEVKASKAFDSVLLARFVTSTNQPTISPEIVSALNSISDGLGSISSSINKLVQPTGKGSPKIPDNSDSTLNKQMLFLHDSIALIMKTLVDLQQNINNQNKSRDTVFNQFESGQLQQLVRRLEDLQLMNKTSDKSVIIRNRKDSLTFINYIINHDRQVLDSVIKDIRHFQNFPQD